MEIKIYTADVTKLEDDNLFNLLYKSLPEERKEKVNRMRLDKDKRLSLGAGTLLKIALKKEGVTNFSLSSEKNKKPYIKNDSNIQFNLSHSGTKVMCVVSDCEIGCDVEQITDINMKIAQKYFYSEEYEALAKCQDKNKRNNLFFRYWTLKESFIKAIGLGFKLPFNKFCIIFDNTKISVSQNVDERTYFFKEFDFNKGYKYSLCSVEKPINEEITEIFF